MTDLNGKKIAIIATDHFEEAELVTPRDELAKAGRGGEDLLRRHRPDPGRRGRHVTRRRRSTSTASSATSTSRRSTRSSYPAGRSTPTTSASTRTPRSIVREALDTDKVVAVICHGPWLLINAGVAKGRTLTSYPSLTLDLENAGATWKDEEVVVDGRLITSRNPDDLPAFVDAISEALTG